MASALHPTSITAAITWGTTTNSTSMPPGTSYSRRRTTTMPTNWESASRYRNHHVAKSRGGGSDRSGEKAGVPNAPGASAALTRARRVTEPEPPSPEAERQMQAVTSGPGPTLGVGAGAAATGGGGGGRGRRRRCRCRERRHGIRRGRRARRRWRRYRRQRARLAAVTGGGHRPAAASRPPTRVSCCSTSMLW